MKRGPLVLRVLALLLLGACSDTGRRFVEVPFAARGTGSSARTVGDWQITLTRAELAIGPIYFCATALAATDLCEDALLEQREAQSFDALDPEPLSLGSLTGVSGTVRSSFYDLGISYFLTQSQAAPRPGAVEGHSAIIEGEAVRGADSFTFRFEIDVVPQTPGDVAVRGARTMHTVSGEGDALVVVVDPVAWLGGVSFDALFARSSAPDVPVRVTRADEGHDAVVLGMTSFSPPSFVWSSASD